MNSPSISVIMSIYSEPSEWISMAIDSILNQTFTDFEFIIINDNPKRKENMVILNKYKALDNRIVIIENEENIGLTKSLNKGLAIAQGKYIARMDSDDIALTERFRIQYNFMENNPEIGVCGSAIECFGGKVEKRFFPEYYDKMFLFFDSVFAHPSVFIRRKVLTDNKICYNEDTRYSQDFDLWVQLYPHTKFYNIQQILLKYRISDSQISISQNTPQLKLASALRRKAFNSYCVMNKIEFELPYSITIQDIKKYKKIFLNNDHNTYLFNVIHFLHYIYRSITDKNINTLLYFITSGDFLRMPPIISCKIVYSLLNKSTNKLLS